MTGKKKVSFATTKTLKKSIDIMLNNCKMEDFAKVEVFIEGEKNEKKYGIVGISHFHAIPNLVLKIKEMKG